MECGTVENSIADRATAGGPCPPKRRRNSSCLVVGQREHRRTVPFGAGSDVAAGGVGIAGCGLARSSVAAPLTTGNGVLEHWSIANEFWPALHHSTASSLRS